MAMTHVDVDKVEDEELFIVTGKDLKALLEVTRRARVGNSRNEYYIGGELSRIVCSATPCPDLIKKE